MEFKKEIPESVKLKLDKVKNLALRGVGGEKAAALNLLEQLASKYGILVEELWENQKHTYEFSMPATMTFIFTQTFISRFGVADEWKELKQYKTRKGITMEARLTRAEYIEFNALYEWHKKNYAAERRRLKKLMKTAYLAKYNLYASHYSEEYEELRNNKSKEISFEDVLAIQGLASSMKGGRYHKQIEE